MNECKKILLVARATSKELIKGQVFVISIIIGAVLAIASYIGVEFSYGAPQKIALDFGMGMIAFVNFGVSIFLGVQLLKKEVESRTLYLILSRPISRVSFCVGKFLGLSLVLLIIDLLISAQTLITYWINDGDFEGLIFWAIFLTYVEGLIILSIVIFFSLITSAIATVMYGMSFYLIGHSLEGLGELSFVKDLPLFNFLVNGLTYIFPDLTRLNIKDYLLYGAHLSDQYLFSATVYGLTYFVVVLSLTCFTFNYRDLE